MSSCQGAGGQLSALRLLLDARAATKVPSEIFDKNRKFLVCVLVIERCCLKTCVTLK